MHTSSLVVGIECGGRKHHSDVIDDEQAGDERQELYGIVKQPHTTTKLYSEASSLIFLLHQIFRILFFVGSKFKYILKFRTL